MITRFNIAVAENAMPNDHKFADSVACCKLKAYNVQLSVREENCTNGNAQATPVNIAESNRYID